VISSRHACPTVAPDEATFSLIKFVQKSIDKRETNCYTSRITGTYQWRQANSDEEYHYLYHSRHAYRRGPRTGEESAHLPVGSRKTVQAVGTSTEAHGFLFPEFRRKASEGTTNRSRGVQNTPGSACF
jgi:hypothetical protein